MNFCQSHIPGASLNRRLPAYETYRPRFDATREALCIACIDYLQTCYSHYFSLVLIPLLVGNQIVDALPLVYFARKVELNLDNCFQYMKVGCCDIEKISNIDIEKKIPVISIFSIFFCCEIIRMKLGFLFREKH